ncbi:MAG TPA: hypothetical protein VKT28_11645 [Puia sp.]|nr:hypothetical protein [Puia sp.]
MEDEVAKHGKEIYATLKSEHKTPGEKIKDILIEIFIIVFAVTLSIWLHSWSERNHQQTEAKEFLTDISEDLGKDIKSMADQKKMLSDMLSSYSGILKLSPKELDTVTNFSINFSLSTFKAGIGDYEGFKSSGKIGYIENKELKKLILEYYQESLTTLDDTYKYQYSKHLELWEMINALGDQNPLSNKIFRSKIIVDAQITQALLNAIDETEKEATALQNKIQAELKK